MNDQKIKLVVVNEHTLGYIHPEMPNTVGVLQASVLKGATFQVHPEPFSTNGKKVRLASKQDFEDFRHSFGGYDNGEYEYQK